MTPPKPRNLNIKQSHPEDFIRCSNCRMHRRLCLCPEIPVLVTRARLVLIVHYKELRRPSNTGLLAAKCLQDSQVHIHGRPQHAPTTLSEELLKTYEPWWLFPSATAEPLTPELVAATEKPIALLVPDGNWSQASRIPKRIAGAENLRHVTLPQSQPSQYRLRRELGRPEGLATMEAIARAFAMIEGNEAVANSLIEVMRLMVHRTLWSKGLLSTEQAAAFLPPSLFRP